MPLRAALMPLRAALLALGLLAAPAARAECAGPGLIDRLTEAERAEVARTVAALPHAEGLIWEARRGAGRILLVGTLHVPDPRLGPLADRAAALIAEAGLLLVEITDADEAAMQAAIASDPALVFLPDGQTLPGLLDAPTWAMVAETARAAGIPPFTLARMKPWLVAMTLATPPCAMPAVLSGAGGLDALLIERAAGAGLPVAALDDWRALLALLDAGSVEEQALLLRAALIDPALQQAMYVTLLDSYFAGRVGEIFALTEVALAEVPGLGAAQAAEIFALFEQTLLADRNRAWMERIRAEAARHPVLAVAVGAAHLPGADGLLRRLEAEGWQIARLY